MEKKKRGLSLGKKMYLFVIAIVLLASVGAGVISYVINVHQIDRYYKNLVLHSAENYASFVDVELMKELRVLAESDEYQALRDKAEEEDDDALVEAYFREKGILDRYNEEREKMIRYQTNMADIKYLYIVVCGDVNADHDMYLMDADDVPIYETGYYEEREEELMGTDFSRKVEPVISHGDWGWLCSGYVPIYDADGNLVCQVGCDVGMEDVMSERRTNLITLILVGLGFAVLVLVFAFIGVNGSVVKPLRTMTREMKKFSPAENRSYEEAGVIDMDLKRKDEINDIYQELRSMQIRIIDYINDITTIQHDKEMAEKESESKQRVIGKIAQEAYKDSLTGVGNITAYRRKEKELNADIRDGRAEFAIVMIDTNNLKKINDTYGHKEGDIFLQGCSKIITDVYTDANVYRVGGDEFIVVLTGADYRRRNELIEKIRAAYAETWSQEEKELWFRYTAAVGMAEFRIGDMKAEETFKRADQFMYEEKQRIKNTQK